MALIKHTDNSIYLFDSHARNHTGMPDENGTAVVIKCDNIGMLVQYLHCLSYELNSDLFEIVPVQFYCCSQNQFSSLLNIYVNPWERQLKETDKHREKRLAKSREYKRKRRLEETPQQREALLKKLKIYRMEHKEQLKAYREKRKLKETNTERRIKLDAKKRSYNKMISQETESKRQTRLEKKKSDYQKKENRKNKSRLKNNI